MKKKAFVTIYVLLLVLVLSITVSFLFGQNKNEIDFNKDLYHKKQALYISESLANLALKDSGLDNYKEKIYQNIIDYYYNIKSKNSKQKNIDKIKSYYPEIEYNGRIYKPKFSYIPTINRLRLESQVSLGETQANTIVDYEIKTKFDFFKEEPIKYDFIDEIKFKTFNLIENSDTVDLDKEDEEKFYKFNGSILIEEVDENKEEPVSIEDELTSNDEEVFDEKSKEISKNDEENTSYESMDESSFKKKNRNFKGIMFIKGDLILRTDLYMEGLLIIDGNIISLASNSKNPNPKLNIKGQVISKKDLNKENLDYKYDKTSYKYITDIENLFLIELMTKRVY